MQFFQGKPLGHVAGLGRSVSVFAVTVPNNQAIGAGPDFQSVTGKSGMDFLPCSGSGKGRLQVLRMALGIGHERLLAAVRFHRGGFVIDPVLSELLPAVVNMQAVFTFQFPA